MGSLYIAGAQCRHAPFKNEDDWEIFDEKEKVLQQIAHKFNVFVERYSLDDEYNFVITNEKTKHECFYSGNAFDYDMTVKTSDTFSTRSKEFIKALNASDIKEFKDLKWSSEKVLYFVVS